jgi:hypothetical protein
MDVHPSVIVARMANVNEMDDFIVIASDSVQQMERTTEGGVVRICTWDAGEGDLFLTTLMHFQDFSFQSE